MGFEVLLGLGVVKKVVDVYRYLVQGEVVQWKQAATIAGSWVVGFVLVFLVAESGHADAAGLVDASFADLALAGIVVGSGAGYAADLSSGGVTVE